MVDEKSNEKNSGYNFVGKGVYRFTGPLGEVVSANFVGCDGRVYRVEIRGNEMSVNGAEMRSWDDRPCEFIGNCIGNNEHCSYESRNLAGPRGEGCTFYDDHKDAEKASKQ